MIIGVCAPFDFFGFLNRSSSHKSRLFLKRESTGTFGSPSGFFFGFLGKKKFLRSRKSLAVVAGFLAFFGLPLYKYFGAPEA